mmetsp:Transcript_32707/g.90295  ORF Transcript_32707/g.90295 Transcript_32707/m.90295 type:complete len:317 (-) Transcript_32707:179-1129(-)
MKGPGLAQEAAQTVIGALDIDVRLERAMREVRQHGRHALRELRAQQHRRDEAVSREVARHLEQQRRLQDEHHRLRGVAEDLARWLLPPGAGVPGRRPVPGSGGSGPPPAPTSPPPTRVPCPLPPPHGSGCYSVVLRKADGLGLGLEVSLERTGRGLCVERIEIGGVVEAWNRRCSGEQVSEREVRPGDIIVRVNEAEEAEAMLREFEARWLLRLTLARGEAVLPTMPLQESTVASSSANAVLRPDAPEFLPDRINNPLRPRQLPVIPEDVEPCVPSETDKDGTACSAKAPVPPLVRPDVHRARTTECDKENQSREA